MRFKQALLLKIQVPFNLTIIVLKKIKSSKGVAYLGPVQTRGEPQNAFLTPIGKVKNSEGKSIHRERRYIVQHLLKLEAI